jgi:hypothetical protein
MRMNAQEKLNHNLSLELFKEDNDLPQDFDGEDCLLEIESKYGRQAFAKGSEGFLKRDWICEWLYARKGNNGVWR